MTATSRSFRAVFLVKREDRLSSSSISTCVYGTTPATGTPQSASSWRRPGSRIVRSPRNLLMIVPLTRARSSGSRSAMVPKSWAKTPPRSMSPMRRTGASTSFARPMFTKSSCLRLISAGLPAPSMTITSFSSRKRFVSSHHVRQEFTLFCVILHRAHVAAHLAVDDDLTADIGSWFQKDRVHPHIGLQRRRPPPARPAPGPSRRRLL